MKNIKNVLFIVLILLASISTIVRAEEIPTTPEPVSIHLTISTNSGSIYNDDIVVNACNSDNNASEEIKATAYCAILQSEVPSEWNWAWAPGAFLDSLNGVEGYTSQDDEGSDVYHYWSWSLNGAEGTTGLNQYELQTDDSILLNFIDPTNPVEEPAVEVVVPTEQNSSSGSKRSRNQNGGSVLGAEIKAKFDLDKAFTFLMSQQSENGSFGGADLYTDWTAIALGILDATDNSRTKLLVYFNSHNTLSSLLTNNERRAMALLALGQNPYSFNGVNYIEAITNSFDGTQFGDANFINDDIFALIPLVSSGYTSDDDIITKDIKFILSKQLADGSWEESVDMTSATIQALKPFDSISQISDALAKSSAYLISKQGINGGWGNVFSTSWAAQAMSTLNASWTKNEETFADYFSTQQVSDGAVLPISETTQNRIWATSYAIPAVLGKSWNAIMHPVSKPANLIPLVALPVVENQAVKETTTIPTPTNIQKQQAAKKITLEEPLAEHVVPLPKPIVLSAAVGKSGIPISVPLTAGGVVVMGLFAYLGRNFFFKK